MIDPALPHVTRSGRAAEFVCDDRHPLFPLTFRVDGRLLSYTREGRYCGEPHDDPLDLFPVGCAPDGPLQYVLELTP